MIQSRLYFLQQMIVYMTNAVRWLHWRGSALAPRIYEGGGTSAHTGTGGSSYKRLCSNLCVIPNQSSDWCGISIVIETTFFFRWGLPHQRARWFAMTGNSIVRC